jgi:hypothetical protein
MTRPKKMARAFAKGVFFSIVFSTNMGLEKYGLQKSSLDYGYINREK